MNERSSSPDVLLAQAGWIRGLAQRLAHDSHEADDAVQETFLAALRTPPRAAGEGPEAARGWLSRVLRNFLRQDARSEMARTRREEERSRPEALADTTELAREVDAQRVVVEELLRLDEPYRSVVLLRYFRDRSAAEIARELKEPPATVRSRLKRGLDMLRERMDERYGGDRALWSTLFLSPSFGSSTSPGDGGANATPGGTSAAVSNLEAVLAMNTLTKALVALGVVVVAGVGFTYFQGVERTDQEPAAPVERLAELETPQAAVLTPDPTPAQAVDLSEERAPVALEKEAPAAAPVEEEAVEDEQEKFDPAGGTATFVDEMANPIAGVRAYLVRDEKGDWRASATPEMSDQEGRVVLSAPMRLEAERGLLVYEKDGFVSGAVPAQLGAGQTCSLGTIVLLPGASVTGTIVDSRGRPMADVDVWYQAEELPDFPEGHLRRRGMGDFFSSELNALATQSGPDGRYVLEGIPQAKGRVWAHAEEMRYSYTDELDPTAGLLYDVDLVLDPLGTEDVIHGLVLLPDGSPYAEKQVSYQFQDTGWSVSSSLTTDKNGRFELVVWRETGHDFTVYGKHGEWAQARMVDVQPGADMQMQLIHPVSVELAVRDPLGEPIDEFSYTMHLGSDDSFERRVNAVAENGIYRFDRPEDEFRLVIRAAGFSQEEVGPFGADRTERVECTLHPVPTVQGIVLAKGKPVGGAKIQLYPALSDSMRLVTNGFPSIMDNNPKESGTSKDDGSFIVGLRQSDEYYVRASADGYAPSFVGPFSIHVDTGMTGLELELSEGGSLDVRVALPNGADPAGLVVGITDGSPHPRTRRVDEDGIARFRDLSVGRYLVRLEEKEIPLNMTTVSSNSVDPPEPYELPWVVEVRDGRTAHYTLVSE